MKSCQHFLSCHIMRPTPYCARRYEADILAKPCTVGHAKTFCSHICAQERFYYILSIFASCINFRQLYRFSSVAVQFCDCTRVRT